MKWKFFNYRPLVVIFLSIIAGILAVNYFYANKLLMIVLVCVYFFALIFYSIKFKKKYLILIAILVSLISAMNFAFQIKNYFRPVEIQANDKITGTVERIESEYNGSFILKNVKVNDMCFDGKVLVYYTADLDYLEDYVDDEIIFSAVYTRALNNLDTSGDIINSSFMDKNVKYSVSTFSIEKISEGTSIRSLVRSKVRKVLDSVLEKDNADIMYSMLVGDRSGLSPVTREYFNNSGLAHLLAVSGLHVGIIVASLYFMLKLFRCNKYANLIIISSFLIFYGYVCAWSYSVVRAIIMAIVLLVAPIIFRQYDSLTSISIAGIIILTLSPSALFELSFLLSFMCVLSIIMLFTYFNKFLNKLKINNAISSVFCLSFIVNIGVIVVEAYFLEEASFINLLSNVIVLPLFSLLFGVVFILTTLGCLLPMLALPLRLIEPAISFVMLVANYISHIVSYINTNSVSFLSIILYAWLLAFASKFNIKNKKGKLVCVLTMTMVLVVQILLNMYVIKL